MSLLERLGIDRMAPAERLGLAQEILESLVAEQPLGPLSEAKRQELDRRLADTPDDGVPWGQIEAAALARCALGGDWSRPEEDAAWAHLQPGTPSAP